MTPVLNMNIQQVLEFQKTSQQVIGMFIRLASPYKFSSSFLKKNFQRKRNYWNNFFSFVFPPIANVRHTRKKIPCIARHALSQRLHREKMPETCKKLQWRSARRERESANGVDKTEIPIQRATTKLTTQCTKFGVSKQEIYLVSI